MVFPTRGSCSRKALGCSASHCASSSWNGRNVSVIWRSYDIWVRVARGVVDFPVWPGGHDGVPSGKALFPVRLEDRSRPRLLQDGQPRLRPGDAPHRHLVLLRPDGELGVEAVLHRPPARDVQLPGVESQRPRPEQVHPGPTAPRYLMWSAERGVLPAANGAEVAATQHADRGLTTPAEHLICEPLNVIRWIGEVVIKREVVVCPRVREPELHLRAAVRGAVEDVAVQVEQELGDLLISIQVDEEFVYLRPHRADRCLQRPARHGRAHGERRPLHASVSRMFLSRIAGQRLDLLEPRDRTSQYPSNMDPVSRKVTSGNTGQQRQIRTFAAGPADTHTTSGRNRRMAAPTSRVVA